MGSATGMIKIRSDFSSQGVRCSGDLYLPDGVERPPVLIMAHSFAAERTFRLPAYAARFVERRLAVYLFDYRCFGDSDGRPRNYVNPWRHLQDWQAALAHVRARPEVDAGRLALWGTSLSGGHALVTAARDRDVAALVLQVPWVDSLTTMAMLGTRYVLRAMVQGLRDLARAVTGGPPHYVKVIGRPDEFAAMNTPESWPGYSSLIPEGSSWRNGCPARGLLALVPYRPIMVAGQVGCPAQVMYGAQDSLISPASVERAASRMRGATLMRFPFGHFDIYYGQAFETAVTMQAEFLVKRLYK